MFKYAVICNRIYTSEICMAICTSQYPHYSSQVYSPDLSSLILSAFWHEMTSEMCRRDTGSTVVGLKRKWYQGSL